MKTRKASIAAVLCGTLSVAALAAQTPAPSRFGEPLSSDLEPTPIASILEDPDAWAGQRVRVAGEVSGVCSRQGCWLDLTSADDATLRVKVDDGVIVFPQEARGHSAVAEGEVEIVEMERQRYEAWLRHVADEEGRDFDSAEVGEGPYRIVRLRATGAEIEGL